MADQVENLINMLVSADARERDFKDQWANDILDSAQLLAAAELKITELRDQKAVDADYIQRLEAQVAALLARVEDAQREIDDGDCRFYELNRQHIDLRSQWAATSDAVELAHEKIAVLEGKVKLGDLSHAWDTYHSVQPNAHEMWLEIVPIAWQAEFENFVTYMGSNQKINAIKSVRAMSGAGLKVSKEFVEEKL